jgi:hypothetical protein
MQPHVISECISYILSLAEHFHSSVSFSSFIVVPDQYIGTVSSSMFAGMMFGAVGWGTCAPDPSLENDENLNL